MTTFQPREAACIVDALNGIRYTHGITKRSHLRANVAVAIEMDGLDNKWGCDGESLVTQLNQLSETQASDVLKQVTEFWEASPHTDIWPALVEHGLAEAE